jgi:hypothetical protein
MAYSLSDLRTLVLQRADFPSNTQFITTTPVGTSELDNVINDSYEELWDLLVATYGSEYFVQVACGTTTAGCSAMDLPEDFFKLVVVLWDKSTTEKFRLERFVFGDWQFASNQSWLNTRPRYRLAHNSLIYDPIPDAAYSIEIWYVPQCERLDAADDEIKTPSWGEYIIVDAARKLKEKEDSDTSALERSKANLIGRIQRTAPPRDLGNPATVVDQRADDFDLGEPWISRSRWLW